MKLKCTSASYALTFLIAICSTNVSAESGLMMCSTIASDTDKTAEYIAKGCSVGEPVAIYDAATIAASIAATVCDFSKEILYANGSLSCIYAGVRSLRKSYEN